MLKTPKHAETPKAIKQKMYINELTQAKSKLKTIPAPWPVSEVQKHNAKQTYG